MKDWPYPRVVAHRGGGSFAPENTLAAIRLGQSLGFRAHEFDVKLSRDGVLLLLHDPTLERTTNGQGRAADLDWAELRKLDAGSWHSEAFRGEPIASFDEAARLLIGKGTMAHIEIKPTPGFDAQTGRRVAGRTRELWRGISPPPVFSSFSFEALMAAKEEAPEVPRAWLISRFTEADWDRLAALDAIAVHTNHRKLDPRNVGRLHDRGYRVQVYTVDDVAEARSLFDAGVDGVITDNLRDFAAAFPDRV
ncbi:MAG TPA: glycerophosphodiester phosphodiesterase [Usitatibacter sp.]|nr:glycerophosphodiester phosphodiesterase [Usitatibacter sp.]